MIICVHQKGEGMTYFDVHNTKQSLISKIHRVINCHHHTRVYTDEYLAYENLKKYGFVLDARKNNALFSNQTEVRCV
jgi:hypothetical protein